MSRAQRRYEQKRAAEREGRMDGYTASPPCPSRMSDHERVGYDRGFREGREERSRLIAEIIERPLVACLSIGGIRRVCELPAGHGGPHRYRLLPDEDAGRLS